MKVRVYSLLSLILISLFLGVSCEKIGLGRDYDRVVLLYLAANNNLSTYAKDNVEALRDGYVPSVNDKNILLVYKHIKGDCIDSTNIFNDLQIAVVDVPFVIIPLEIDEVYPLAQNEAPIITDEDSKKFVKEELEKYMACFDNVIINSKILDRFDMYTINETVEDLSGNIIKTYNYIIYIIKWN